MTVHAYTPRAVRQGIEAGVKCIDHGQLLDEATAKLMTEKGLWWSLQPFLDHRPSTYPEGSPNRLKQLQMFAGTDTAYGLAKKYKTKTACAGLYQRTILASCAPCIAATSGLKSVSVPYAGPVRIAKPVPGQAGCRPGGALPDLLLVEGDPISNIKLLENPAKNLLVILKDGKVYKNAAVTPGPLPVAARGCPPGGKRRPRKHLKLCRPRVLGIGTSPPPAGVSADV